MFLNVRFLKDFENFCLTACIWSRIRIHNPKTSVSDPYSTESGSSQKSSVVDPEWFIPDPDPALNFPSSGSGSNPCYLSIFGNCKQNHLKFNHKEESINYLPFFISYYSPTVHKVQNSQITFLLIWSFIFSWIRIQAKVPDPSRSGSTTLQKSQSGSGSRRPWIRNLIQDIS